MEIIIHRINNPKELDKIPKNFGVEIDVRNNNKDLILQHDPYKRGHFLEEFLKKYNHGTLILNIKSEQIEFKIIRLLKKYKINKYFFLDSSYPVIIKMIKKRINKLAIRVSDYESFENIKKVKKNIKWVWLEIFQKLKISKKQIDFLKRNNIKICLVSPELHNRPKNIKKIAKFLKTKKIKVSAVCTKYKYKNFWLNQ